MRKITCYLILFLFSVLSFGQVPIGNGNNESQNLPFEPYYGYSYTQTVYLASEINASGDITGLQWYFSGTTALPNSQNLVIYLAESTRDSYSSTTDWEPITSFTQVYAGGITVSGAGWVTINFDTPFTYSGTNNLIVAVEENMAGYDASSDDFYNTAVSTARSIYYRNDSTDPDPASPPTANGTPSYIPNVVLLGITPACVTPDSLLAQNATVNSVDLSWNDPSGVQFDFEYVVQPQGTGLPTGNGTAWSDVMVTEGGLTANTAYEVYVRADCGGGSYSTWTGPVNFRTPCDAITTFPFVETFNTDSSTVSCWGVIDGNSDGDQWTMGTTIPRSGRSAQLYTDYNTSNNDYLITPHLDLGTTGKRIRFWVRHYSNNEPDNLNVKLSTTSADISSFTENLLTLSTTQITTTYTEYVINLSAYSGLVYIAFAREDAPADGWYIAIDDVTVEDLPSCLEPESLMASAITSSSVQLDWADSTGVQNDYEYVIQAPGTGEPTGSGVAVSGLTVTDSSLSPDTAYEVYLRADCGGGDYSAWIGPINFRTECVSYIAPFVESFMTNSLPSCWVQGGATSWEFGSVNGTTPSGFADYGASSVEDHTAGGGGTFIGMDGSDNSGGEVSTLLTPFIDVSTLTSPYLTYWVFSNNTNNSVFNQLTVEFFDGSSWNLIETIQGNLGSNWFKYTADLTAFTISGDVQVRFTVTASSTGSTFYNDILIDDVSIDEAPSCIEPESIVVSNVTSSSAQIDWVDPTGVQFDFEYVIQPAGTGVPSGSGIPVSDVTVTDSSLSGGVEYEVYIRTDCGGGDYSVWAGPIYFTTPNQIVCGTPLNTVYCYGNNDTTTWSFISSDGSPLRITFNAGGIESCCDDILIYDGVDNTGTLLYQGNNGGDLTGLTFDTTSDALYMEIDADGSVSCSSGSFSTQWDFTVVCATCVNPTATFTTVPDCSNSQFSIDVDLTSLGTATSVSISDGTTTLTGISGTGITTFGPYADLTSVTLIISNEQDNSCSLNSGAIMYACPPANDECANATVLTTGGVFADNAVIGHNLAATDSGETAPGCAYYQGGDVWYSVTVPASGSITIETNNDYANGSSLTDTGMAVYSGSCGSLSLIECDDDDSPDGNFSLIALTGQTPGDVLYVSVWSYGNFTEGTFQVSAYDASLSASVFESDMFKAYPNPVRDILNLEYSVEISEVRVVNLLGQEVLYQEVNTSSAQINMSSLSAGTYIVNVQAGDIIKTLKVIKE